MVFLTSNNGGYRLNQNIQYTYENALTLLYGLRNPGIDALERQHSIAFISRFLNTEQERREHERRLIMRARGERDQYRKQLKVSDKILQRLDSNLEGISEQETQHIVAACALHWRRKTLAAQLTRANTRLEILQKTTKSLHEELRAGSQNVEPIVLNIQINEALALPTLDASVQTLDASVQTNIMPAPQAGDASMIPHSVVLGAMAVGKLFAKVPLTPGNLSAAATGAYLTYEVFGANLLRIPVSPLSRPVPALGQWVWTTVKPKPKLTVPANCRPKEDEGTQAAVIGISPIPIVPPVPTEL